MQAARHVWADQSTAQLLRGLRGREWCLVGLEERYHQLARVCGALPQDVRGKMSIRELLQGERRLLVVCDAALPHGSVGRSLFDWRRERRRE